MLSPSRSVRLAQDVTALAPAQDRYFGASILKLEAHVDPCVSFVRRSTVLQCIGGDGLSG